MILVVFTREALVHNISALCHRENDLENWNLNGSAFTLQIIYLVNSRHSKRNRSLVKSGKCTLQTGLSTKNNASIVPEEFYGLQAEFYGHQRFIELGIKNNRFKWFMA